MSVNAQWTDVVVRTNLLVSVGWMEITPYGLRPAPLQLTVDIM